MTSDFCSGSSHLGVPSASNPCAATEEHNYYSWTGAATNDYDVWVRYQLPSDFDGWASNSSIQMYGWRTSATEKVELSVYNSAFGQCGSTTEINSSNTTWQTLAMTGSETTDANCNLTNMPAGSMIYFRVHMTAAASGNYARAGEINFTYLSKF
jgi:hypothetical protein